MMRACIHRGAETIGGSCIEVECDGKRLLLDLGLQLDDDVDTAALPPTLVDRTTGGANDVLAVIISHNHPDHAGLVPRLARDVPVYGPATAQRMQLAGAVFTGTRRNTHRPWHPLTDREPLRLGPFSVTPLSVDHSAYESYALLVDAGGRRLLYTGDLRRHGRKPGMWRRLCEQSALGVHALLLEGTTLNRDGAASPSERDVELALATVCAETAGLVLVCYSGHNIDRLVSVYRAAKRSGRVLVLDAYGAAIAAATERDSIPQAHWEGVRVLLPQAQRRRVIDRQAFTAIEPLAAHRIYPKQLRERAADIVLTMRGSMTGDLDRADCLAGAAAVWSMWPGYLDSEHAQRFTAWLAGHGIDLTRLHASGHASPDDLRALAAAIEPEYVVPVHTAAPERYQALYASVEIHGDGEWWSV